MTTPSLLADAALWTAALPSERAAATVAALHELGGAFRPLHPESGLVTHVATDLPFAVVPGGTFTMGITDKDLAEARELLPMGEDLEEIVARAVRQARPVREVTVRPFLCAVSPLTSADTKRITGGKLGFDTFDRGEAVELARTVGLRLPSEAELEWLARDGRGLAFTLDAVRCLDRDRRGALRSSFGVDKIEYPTWAEDDWHGSYDGAPTTSEPWMNGDPNGVYRGGTFIPVQDRAELFEFFAGLRRYGRDEDADEEGDDDGYVPDCTVRFAASFAERARTSTGFGVTLAGSGTLVAPMTRTTPTAKPKKSASTAKPKESARPEKAAVTPAKPAPAKGGAITLVRSGSATEPQSDKGLRPPKKVEALLTADAPKRPAPLVRPTGGTWWTQLSQADPRNKDVLLGRLRCLDPQGRVRTAADALPTTTEPSFDFERMTALCGGPPGQAYEIDLATGRSVRLALRGSRALEKERPIQISYLFDGRVLVCVMDDDGRILHVLERAGSTLTSAFSVRFKGRFNVAHKRAVIGGSKSVLVLGLGAGENQFRVLAELPEPCAFFLELFDGEVHAYGPKGRFVVQGVLDAWRRCYEGAHPNPAPAYEGPSSDGRTVS